MTPDSTIDPDPAQATGTDAEEVLHPQESGVVRDVQGNPLPGTDDAEQDSVARPDGRGA